MTVDLTPQIHQYLTSAPSSLFAQQDVTMLTQWEGDENLLWRVRSGGEDAVAKLFLDAGQARSRRQFDGHRVFAPLGLAPVPLWADRYPHGLSRQLLVYRWSAGETIDVQDQGSVEAWAEAIAALHATPADEVQRFSPHPLNLDFYWRIEESSIAQVEQWFASSDLALRDWFSQIAVAATSLVADRIDFWRKAAPTPIHGDLSFAHTLVERSSVILLDWEMFGLGDPAQDVARLLQREEQTLGPEKSDAWLERYLIQSEDSTLAARIATYRQLLDVHNVVYLLVGLQQHTTGQLDPALLKALPYVQTTLAIALERAIATFDLTISYDAPTAAAELGAWLTTQAVKPS
jgi:thiamine kinase-like enzyme